MSTFIGPFEIVEELGRGGMGVVYKAREESLQRFVAIKMLGHALTDNESVVQRFMREARAVADLNHPNLVQVFRVDKHDDQPYFAMEYVEGESLKTLIQRERQMQPTRALQILKEVAMGLAAAHEKGVIHRDIKPENIMLTKYGGVKVVDFGIARVDEPGTRLTTTGIGLGTPSYLSPEVCMSQDVDQRSDIFSLGVVLFEMLTGETPFKSDSPFELMTKVVEAKVPDIQALNPNVDEGARKILARMIAKRPKLRYQNCNELISDIEDYRAGRVPRWARNALLETVPARASAGTSVEPGPPTRDDQPGVDERTTPMPSGERVDSGTPGSGATRAVGSRDHRAGSGRWIAVAAVLLLLVGAGVAGGWMLTGGGERPWSEWFGGGDDDRSVVATTDAGRIDDAPSRRLARVDEPAPRSSGPRPEPSAASGGESAVLSNEPTAVPDSGTASTPPGSAASAEPARPAGTGTPEPDRGTAVTAEAGSDRDTGPRDDSDPAAEGSRPTGSNAGVPAPGPAADGQASSGPRFAAAGEASGRPAAPAGTTAPTGADARNASMPAAPRIAAIAVGDPAVARPILNVFKRGLARADFDILDEQLMDGLVYAESLADVVRTARDHGADVLVYIDVVPTGERELRYFGRAEVQLLAELEVRVIDLHEQRNLGRPVTRALEYVSLTADREARGAAAPVARNVVNRLRALRAMRGSNPG